MKMRILALLMAVFCCLGCFSFVACDNGSSEEITTVPDNDETTVADGDETTVAGGDETTVTGGDETTATGGDETTAGGKLYFN